MWYLSNNVDDVTRNLKMKIAHKNNVTGILEKENQVSGQLPYYDKQFGARFVRV